LLDKLKKEGEKAEKSRKTEEEKTNPTVEFLRQVVVLAFKKHVIAK
jgi:hypothetical protein